MHCRNTDNMGFPRSLSRGVADVASENEKKSQFEVTGWWPAYSLNEAGGGTVRHSCPIFTSTAKLTAPSWCLHYVMLVIPFDFIAFFCLLNIFHFVKKK